MPKHVLKDVTMTAMSLIFSKGVDGRQWAPINQDARLVTVKGAVQQPQGRSTYDKLVEQFGEERAKQFKGLWVADGTPDGVDHDDDGAQDYEQILSILFGNLGVPSPYGWDWYCAQGGFINDITRAMQITDIEMRSAAIATGIDNFLSALDDVRSGGDGTKKAAAIEAFKSGPKTIEVDKAGARHSAADKTRIDQMGAHAKEIADHAKAIKNGKVSEIGDHADAIGEKAQSISDLHEELSAGADASKTEGGDGKDGFGEDDNPAKGAAEKADDITYADPGYQEDKKKRYPVDTEAHARAAWSYINKKSNAEKYSADDLKKVRDKIMAACEKFGIEINDDETGKGAAIGATLQPFDIKGALTEALGEALKPINDRLNAIEKAGPQPPPSKLELSINAIKAAREPSAPGGIPRLQHDGTYKGAIAVEKTGENAAPQLGSDASVRDVIRAARIGAGGANLVSA